MRLGLAALLLLTGCSAFGFSDTPLGPQLGANNIGSEDAHLLPVGLLDELGEEAGGAIAVAQNSALQSETAGTPVLWNYDDLSGRVIPGPKYMVNTRLCRDLVHVAERDRHRISGRATLCLSRAGSWERIG